MSFLDSKQMLAGRVGILTAGLLLAGCVPVPHRVYFAPSISGTVTSDGTPVEGADLHLSGNFTKRTASARTDSSGRFKIGPLRTWEAITGLLGDPGYAYSLSIRVSGAEYTGLTVERLGYAPTELKITCDLAKPAITGRTPQYCRPTDTSVHP